MSLSRIDPSKPLVLYGIRTEQSTDPGLIALASELKTPALLNVMRPVTDMSVLSAEDGQALIQFLAATKWRETVEPTLQCVSQSLLGEPLLTCWIAFKDFQALAGVFAAKQASRLTAIIESWSDIDIHEVCLEGGLDGGAVLVSNAI